MIETYRTWSNKSIAMRRVERADPGARALRIAVSSWAFSPSEQELDGEQLYQVVTALIATKDK